MKLVSAIVDGSRRAGVLEDDRVYVTELAGLEVVIASGVDPMAGPGRWIPLSQLQLDVPIRPPLLWCTGSNYRDHVEERHESAVGTNAPQGDFEFFVKAGQTVAAPDEPLRLTDGIGGKIDQETEVGLILKPGCPRNVPVERALDYLFGLIVVNDLTARDKQVRMIASGEIFMVLGASKNFDGATRLSNHVVTVDEVADLNDLALRTYLNGDLVQSNSTANLINSFAFIIHQFSTGIALSGGAVISTGTPGGTGWGQDRELGGKGFTPPGCKPGRYLSAGDRVRSEVVGIGEITFAVE
jgi:2-keto-4-pentenoate hydratase/2-oxohepta-3-ene-1,7-dioic acid hydratase in catechol pathway